jgi:hypothetical protein
VINIMPAFRAEIAAISGVAAIVSANPSGTGARVRNDEPAPTDSTTPYRAFVVLVEMPWNRHPRLPIVEWQIIARCYGRDVTEARNLYAALSDGMHGVGPRVNASRIAIYRSHEEEGEFGTDPATQQPYVEATISGTSATVAVPA